MKRFTLLTFFVMAVSTSAYATDVKPSKESSPLASRPLEPLFDKLQYLVNEPGVLKKEEVEKILGVQIPEAYRLPPDEKGEKIYYFYPNFEGQDVFLFFMEQKIDGVLKTAFQVILRTPDTNNEGECTQLYEFMRWTPPEKGWEIKEPYFTIDDHHIHAYRNGVTFDVSANGGSELYYHLAAPGYTGPQVDPQTEMQKDKTFGCARRITVGTTKTDYQSILFYMSK